MNILTLQKIAVYATVIALSAACTTSYNGRSGDQKFIGRIIFGCIYKDHECPVPERFQGAVLPHHVGTDSDPAIFVKAALEEELKSKNYKDYSAITNALRSLGFNCKNNVCDQEVKTFTESRLLLIPVSRYENIFSARIVINVEDSLDPANGTHILNRRLGFTVSTFYSNNFYKLGE